MFDMRFLHGLAGLGIAIFLCSFSGLLTQLIAMGCASIAVAALGATYPTDAQLNMFYMWSVFILFIIVWPPFYIAWEKSYEK